MNKYKRILLKLSGEALSGDKGFGIDDDMIKRTANIIKSVHERDVQIAIVTGGGNFFRGRTSKDMKRYKADYIGMLATIMNSLHLQAALSSVGLESVVQSSIRVEPICDFLNVDVAIEHLNSKKIVIFSGGTGAPFFSTDTTASLRACEINADAVFAAKSIDGVYDSDPKENKDAKKYESLSYQCILSKHLNVMDMSAAAMCMDNDIPTIVFSLKDPQNILKVLNGENIGTIIE